MPKLICPECNRKEVETVDSKRGGEGAIIYARHCRACGTEWTVTF